VWFVVRLLIKVKCKTTGRVINYPCVVTKIMLDWQCRYFFSIRKNNVNKIMTFNFKHINKLKTKITKINFCFLPRTTQTNTNFFLWIMGDRGFYSFFLFVRGCSCRSWLKLFENWFPWMKTLIPATNRLSGYRDIIIAQPEEVIDFEIDDWHWGSNRRYSG
jgi:hypothetical protein